MRKLSIILLILMILIGGFGHPGMVSYATPHPPYCTLEVSVTNIKVPIVCAGGSFQKTFNIRNTSPLDFYLQVSSVPPISGAITPTNYVNRNLLAPSATSTQITIPFTMPSNCTPNQNVTFTVTFKAYPNMASTSTCGGETKTFQAQCKDCCCNETHTGSPPTMPTTPIAAGDTFIQTWTLKNLSPPPCQNICYKFIAMSNVKFKLLPGGSPQTDLTVCIPYNQQKQVQVIHTATTLMSGSPPRYNFAWKCEVRKGSQSNSASCPGFARKFIRPQLQNCCDIWPTNTNLTPNPPYAEMSLNQTRNFDFIFKNPCAGSGSITYTPQSNHSYIQSVSILSPYASGQVPNGANFTVRVKVKIPLNAPQCYNQDICFKINLGCTTSPNPRQYCFTVNIRPGIPTINPDSDYPHVNDSVHPDYYVGPSNPSPTTHIPQGYVFNPMQKWTLKNTGNCRTYYHFQTYQPSNVKFQDVSPPGNVSANHQSGSLLQGGLVVWVDPGQTVYVSVKFTAAQTGQNSNPPGYPFHWKVFNRSSCPTTQAEIINPQGTILQPFYWYSFYRLKQ